MLYLCLFFLEEDNGLNSFTMLFVFSFLETVGVALRTGSTRIYFRVYYNLNQTMYTTVLDLQ